MKLIKRVIDILTCLLGAWYLTKLVDEITLSTNLQKIFIYLYFLIMLAGITFVYYKNAKLQIKCRKKFKIIAVVISTLTLILFGGNILPKEYKTNTIQIKAVNEKNDLSQGFECWITKIEIDGVIQDLSELKLDENWEYKVDNNSLFVNAIDSEKEITLNFKPAKSISISFVKHAWSGKIEIESQTYNEKIDLYDNEGNQQICNIYGATQNLSLFNQILLYTGYWLIMSSIITILLILICNKFNDDKSL